VGTQHNTPMLFGGVKIVFILPNFKQESYVQNPSAPLWLVVLCPTISEGPSPGFKKKWGKGDSTDRGAVLKKSR